MNTKKFAGASAAAIGAATAVTALLLGSTAAVADEGRGVDSAYGISATGLIPIAPTPEVTSEDGEFIEDNIADISAIPGTQAAGITAELLHVEAEAAHAETSVVKFRLAEVLRADLIRTYCIDGDGGLELVNAELLGTPLVTPTISGQRVDATPLARVTLGDQVRNEDGSVTVTGIKITLLPGAATNPNAPLDDEDRAQLPVLGELLGGAPLPTNLDTVGDIVDQLGLPVGSGALQTITIGSATCTEAGDDHGDGDWGDDEDGDDDGDDSTAVPAAPAPIVVEEVTVPVTH